MSFSTARRPRPKHLAVLSLAAVLGASCDGEEAPTPTGPGAPTTPAARRPLYRAASFASDLPTVNLLVDGELRYAGLSYSRITSYEEIAEGTHRFELRPQNSRDSLPDPLQVSVTAARGDALTLVAAGVLETHSLQLLVLRDELTTEAGRARLRFVHAIPDFPAPLDLSTERTGVLFSGVDFLGATAYRGLDQGNYDFEVRRSETAEVVIPISQGLARNANYTLFAFGSLRRGDFGGRVVLNAGAGAPALRR